MTDNVQDFRLYSEKTLALCQQKIQQYFESWSHDWFPKSKGPSVSQVKMAERNDVRKGEIIRLSNADKHWLVLTGHDHHDMPISHLFPSSPVSEITNLKSSSLVGKVIKNLWQDLLSQFCDSSQPLTIERHLTMADLEKKIFYPGYGALVAKIQMGEDYLSLLLSPQLSAKIVQEVRGNSKKITYSPSCTHPATLLEQHALSLHAYVGETTISLHELSRLKQGETLRLTQNIKQPLTLKIKNSDIELDGQLCRHHQYKALQLVPNEPKTNIS